MCTIRPSSAAGVTLNWQPPVDVLRDEAVRAAQQADAVVAFVGLSPESRGRRDAHPGARLSVAATARTSACREAQQQLLEALAATGKPLVVVLMSGSALAVNWAQEHAAAVLEAWYPGEEGGTAIAETLAGATIPAAGCPLLFTLRSTNCRPSKITRCRTALTGTFNGKPLYGFGYGLSYSKFEYSNLRLSAEKLEAGQPLTVEADVRNTTAISGDEVAELYLEYAPSPSAPLRALKGFERVHLVPGETRHVAFKLDPRDLSQVTEAGEHRIVAGSYSVFVGGRQPAEGAPGVEAKFQITGNMTLPR